MTRRVASSRSAVALSFAEMLQERVFKSISAISAPVLGHLCTISVVEFSLLPYSPISYLDRQFQYRTYDPQNSALFS